MLASPLSSALSSPLSSSILYLRSSLSISSLPDFIHNAWPLVEPAQPLLWNWHHDEVCSALTQASYGEIKRLIINIPPGSSKSLIVSVFWPAWEWLAISPSLRYLTFSYTKDNTIRDNRRMKSIVTSDWYLSLATLVWGGEGTRNVHLLREQHGKIRFDNVSTGWRIASSVGGLGTGDHPDRIIIDDPLKAQSAGYPDQLATCNSWYDGTVSTRQGRSPVTVLVMQRLAQKDLTGHLLRKDRRSWVHICFPMRFEPESAGPNDDRDLPDPRDHRVTPGELLWTETFPEEKVAGMELILGPYGASGQLQQNPIPRGGGLIQRAWFKFVETYPARCLKCRGWDTADTSIEQDQEGGNRGRGNFTVGTLIGYDPDDEEWYVIDNRRGKLSTGDVHKEIVATAKVDGKKVMIAEGSGSGKSATNLRVKSLAGYDYKVMPERESKEERLTKAGGFRAQCEGGNVNIVVGDWNDAYLDVLEAFPVGAFDDDVDSTSNAFNRLVELIDNEEGGPIVWRGKRKRG
jgi:predicted phage terminase large subunit-like protein